MKKLFGLWLFLSFCFSQGIIAQIYDDGIRSYKAANTAFLMKDAQAEQEKLEEAFKIFEPLAKSDTKSLIMHYFLSIRLGKPFSLKDLVFQYVKKEHKDFVTVEQIPLYGDHKTLILDKLKEIAEQNENRAITLLEEAKNHAKREEYQDALDKLQQVEKLWDIDEVPALKSNYTRLKQEKEKERIINNVKDLINRGFYKDALDDLINNKGALSGQEFDRLEKEIKEKWAKGTLTEANKKFKNKEYDDAIRLSIVA